MGIEVVHRRGLAVEEFSKSFLSDLGAFDHPFFQNQSVAGTFTNRFTAHILAAIFPPGHNPKDALDGKRHTIDVATEEYLISRFSPYGVNYDALNFDQAEKKAFRAINLETRYIFMIKITPWLKATGLTFYFVEDFLSTLSGKPQNRFADHINEDLKEGVSWSLSKLMENQSF